MSHQVHRIIKILTLLSTGRRLSTGDIVEIVRSMPEAKTVTRRQIQRDLVEIEQGGIPIEIQKVGQEYFWSVPSHYRSLAPLGVTKSEVLSLHLLKGLLQSFRNTKIETDVSRVIAKIERIAPGNVFLNAEFLSEVSPGQYVNVPDDKILDKILVAIVDPRWDRVRYASIAKDTVKTFTVSFCRLVNHSGRLYVIAWHPKYEHYITLAADRIDHVETDASFPMPLHTFSEKAYVADRFGVYEGKPMNIVLRIKKSSAHFFMQRMWHTTQSFKELRGGDVQLSFTAPLSPELVSWVMSWAHEVRVVKPAQLVQVCKERAEEIGRW